MANKLVGLHQEQRDPPAESFDAVSRESGLTPLMLCSRHGAIGVAKVLIEAGANVNTRDANGNTALHHTWWETKGRIIHNARMYDFLCTIPQIDKEAKNNDGFKPEMPEDEAECVIS